MPTTKPIFVLNGPNLNLLGTREPHIYGYETLADVQALCEAEAARHGCTLTFRQSNHEGVLVDWIQEARTQACALVLNPGAYGHTSVAIHDALKALEVPVVECHLSNLAKREPFRHHSYVSSAARGLVAGFGAISYELAVTAAARLAQAGPSPATAKP
ncbi:MAG TPA: type II 3-dehydroquinate dehydratase [Caulobacteraceae bacterium]|jgi:3-dehydroquinate dehydratase-2|nr:type II 3-dehydroquinate dehydratase [Caulobacteraceae bacterium]